MKAHWEGKDLKFHRECSQKCYDLPEKCPTCPRQHTISDANLRNAFIGLAAVAVVVVFYFISKF